MNMKRVEHDLYKNKNRKQKEVEKNE